MPGVHWPRMSQSSRARLEARITADTVRHLAALAPERYGSFAAIAVTATDPEERLLAETSRIAAACALSPHIEAVRSWSRLLLLAVCLIGCLVGVALLTGAGLASASGQVNIYAVWLALIGVHGLFFLLWLASLLFWPAAAVAGLPGFLSRLLKLAPERAAAVRARYDWSVGPRLRPWGTALLLHLYWVTALTTALLLLLLWLSVEEVDFAWETTLLGARHFQELTASLAALPALLGFPVPDAAQVVASGSGAGDTRLSAQAATALRHAWSGFLLGSVVSYALIPRCLAALVCLALWRHRRFSLRLDLTHPGFAALLTQPLTASARLPVSDSDTQPLDTDPAAPLARLEQPARFSFASGAVVGLELSPATPWPPFGTANLLDLGRIEDGAALPGRAAASGDAALVIAVPATRAPDRGLRRWLGELAGQWPGPRQLLLLDAELSRARLQPADHAERLRDWCRSAAAAGIEVVGVAGDGG